MKECQNPKTWRHCGQRHHQSIFFVACQESPRPKEISPKETKTITTTERNKAKATVLCWAVNNVISETASVRILLDTGSQRRYIKNRSKSKLNLSLVKSETLHLNTFGDVRYKKQQCDVVNLHLQGSQGEIEVSALCFTKICSAVSAKVNVDDYAHLQGLALADASIVKGDQQNIDVFIGSDYYFDVV